MTALPTGRVIDVHAHFVPEVYRQALTDGGILTVDQGMTMPAWSADLALEVMDRNGIDLALLSVSSPALTLFEGADQAALAHAVNRAAAVLVADHPGRFGALATLPCGDPAAAVREIGHVLDGLGLDGFILETNHRGTYPSDPVMVPVMTELNRRGALVLLHPTSPACARCLGARPAPLIEFPFETTRAVTEMLYAGTLSRFPAIRFVLAHAGGTLPFLANRIAGFSALPAAAASPGVDPESVIHQLRRLWYDTALSTSPTQLFGLRQLVGADRILFGSDWPFSPEPVLAGCLADLKSSNLFDATDLARILGGNAAALLRGDQRAV